jgi:hypothetical protein
MLFCKYCTHRLYKKYPKSNIKEYVCTQCDYSYCNINKCISLKYKDVKFEFYTYINDLYIMLDKASINYNNVSYLSYLFNPKDMDVIYNKLIKLHNIS